MIRIADILSGPPEPDKPKDKKEEKQKVSSALPNIDLVKGEPSPEQIPPTEKQEPQEPSLIELSKSMLDKVKLESPQESQVLYNELAGYLRQICKNITAGNALDLSSLQNSLNALIDQIALGNEEFLILVNQPYEGPYLYPHMVNVCVLSILLGRQVGFNKSRLLELALGALFHDIGLLQFEQVIYAARKITSEEYEQIKRHPITGSQILEQHKEILRQSLSIILQHHERLDGTGYPANLKADKINEYAQIAGIANTYDSLIHKRPFRERLLNDQAIRLMVEKKSAFNTRFLKLFIEAVSLYPLSSWVKLSSGEIAKVIGINKASLLKPLVKIFFDKEGKRLDVEKTIDLGKQPNIYVKEQMPDEIIELKLKVS